MQRRIFIAMGASAVTLQGATAELKLDAAILVAHIEYISWAARRDMDVIRKLSSEQITRQLVSSFPSILATLQHLYWGDMLWFSRLRDESVVPNKIPIPQSFAELDEKWQKLLDEMKVWARSQTRAPWEKPRMNDAKQLEPRWWAVMHLSNHDSYHRGQLTTLIRQVGGTPTNTDLIYFYREHFK